MHQISSYDTVTNKTDSSEMICLGMMKVLVEILNKKGIFDKYTSFLLKSLLAIIVLAGTFLIFPPVDKCEANAGQPPSILIIVPYAPDDLEISVVNEKMDALITRKAFETYYTFYYTGLKSTEYTLRVTTSENSFDAVFRIRLSSYNNTFVLDLDKGIFTAGMPLSRSVMLVSLRVILTLGIEALVFLGFGFKKKKSWIIFLVFNLITHGLLNIWIDGSSSTLDSYLIFPFIFWELVIIASEMVLFSIFIDEKRLMLTNLYVISANILSLFIGGFLITVLPV